MKGIYQSITNTIKGAAVAGAILLGSGCRSTEVQTPQAVYSQEIQSQQQAYEALDNYQAKIDHWKAQLTEISADGKLTPATKNYQLPIDEIVQAFNARDQLKALSENSEVGADENLAGQVNELLGVANGYITKASQGGTVYLVWREQANPNDNDSVRTYGLVSGKHAALKGTLAEVLTALGSGVNNDAEAVLKKALIGPWGYNENTRVEGNVEREVSTNTSYVSTDSATLEALAGLFDNDVLVAGDDRRNATLWKENAARNIITDVRMAYVAGEVEIEAYAPVAKEAETQTQPAKPEPAKPEPAKPEPAKPEPAKPGTRHNFDD